MAEKNKSNKEEEGEKSNNIEDKNKKILEKEEKNQDENIEKDTIQEESNNPSENASILDENLQLLLSKEEREKMEKNLDLVVGYLDEIGIVDINVDRKKLIIAVPFDYEDFTFLSHIVLSADWILIKTSIFELERLPEQSLINLFAEILKGNFILNSVVYSLDPENKSIWAQADVPISADFDTFKLNYFSIVFAIDYFMKNISPKLQLNLKSTAEKEDFQNTNSNLYI